MKITTVLLFLFTGLLSLNSLAQVPSIQWQNSLGGSLDDIASSVQETSDGGFIVAGYSDSNDGDVSGNHGGDDVWVLKLDEQGNLIWQNALGGSSDDAAYSIQETSDGGFILTGWSESNDGDVSGNYGERDAWVLKLDAQGNLIWQNALGGSLDDSANSIKETSDGGFIVVGWSFSDDGDVSGNHGGRDAWVFKLDALGDLIWQNALGGSLFEVAYSVEETSDGGFIVAGLSASNSGDVSGNHGDTDAWVFKLDGQGDLIWQNALGGSSADQAESVQETSDGGFIVAGRTYSNDGDVSGNHGIYDAWVVKLDVLGNLIWQNALGGSAPDYASSIQETSYGGFIVAGRTGSNDGDVSGNNGGTDAWVLKLDLQGNLIWQRTLGGSSYDRASSVKETSDGGFIVAGPTRSNDGDVSGNNGEQDFWLVKLNSTIGIQETNAIGFILAPNPTDGIVNIALNNVQKGTITVVDAAGREVLQQEVAGKDITLDLSDEPDGLYIVTVQTAHSKSSHQLVLE